MLVDSVRQDIDAFAQFSLNSCNPCVMVEYFKIGKFVTAHGVKGELVLKHELGKKTSLKGLHTVFVEERKNSFLPWFIETAKIKNEEEVFIKLEGVSTREAALKLTQKEVWFTEADLKKFSAKSSPINLLGYTIINEETPSAKLWRSLNKHIKCFAGSR